MIVIITDLKHFRGFHVVANERDHLNPKPILKEIDLPPLLEGPKHIKDTVSDQAGRFRSDGNPGMAIGEAHGLEQEQERRNISRVAQSIEALLHKEGVTHWSLAAPQTINARLLEDLEPNRRNQLKENLPTNLCKQPILEIQKRFQLELPEE